MKILAVLLVLCATGAAQAETALQKSCENYMRKPTDSQAIEVVATAMGYTTTELCQLPHLLDIYVDRRNFLNKKNEIEPHIWVTLHYNEHSCQYFVREADLVVTRKNCYNTW
ncbi:MAG: hypothetical protein KF799_13255 [Bdellovibrionales bacterium]|nr:hypothetical protein [Bdellovibrionales bacterium]